MAFPTTLDSPKNTWLPTERPLGHAAHHNAMADLLMAIQARIGINGSAVTTSLDYITASLSTGLTNLSNSAVLKTTDQTVAGIKTFTSDSYFSGNLYLKYGIDIGGGSYRVTRALSNSISTKNNSNVGGVKWVTYVDADGLIVGNMMWSLWGYPLKSADGSIGGSERFISCSFPTYDGATTYTKQVSIDAALKLPSAGTPGIGKTLQSDAAGVAIWDNPAKATTVNQTASFTTSVTMNCDIYTEYDITAQAGALLFNNPSGTPKNGQKLLIRIKPTGAYAFTYGTQIVAGATALLIAGVSGKKSWIGLEWDSTDSKWYCIASGTQP